MPGGFTHFGLVKELGINRTLMSIKGMSHDIADAIQEYYGYVDLGAVAPDLPYLTPLSSNWADAFHHQRTIDVVRVGVRRLESLDDKHEDRRKLLAWLFGYASHAVADMIAHPVIAIKVGEYEENKTEHRVCEMNQDTYVFSHYFGDAIDACEYLDHGIKTCTDDGRSGAVLAKGIGTFWTEVLREVYPDKGRSAPASWFRQFVTVIDGVAEEGGRCLAMRGSAEGGGIVYPQTPNMTYVDDLKSPYGESVTFDDLFRRFQEETKVVWGQMAQAIVANDATLIKLPNGDFDTGVNLAGGQTSIFWGQK
jgi:hypothetical protein